MAKKRQKSQEGFEGYQGFFKTPPPPKTPLPPKSFLSGEELFGQRKEESRAELYRHLRNVYNDNKEIRNEADKNIKDYMRLKREIFVEQVSQKVFTALLSKRFYPYLVTGALSLTLAFGGFSYMSGKTADEVYQGARATLSGVMRPTIHSTEARQEGPSRQGSLSGREASSRREIAARPKTPARPEAPSRRESLESKLEKESRWSTSSTGYYGKAASVSYNSVVQKSSEYLYFISRGDTLSGIAKKLTGDAGNWGMLQSYNSLPSTLIEVNQALIIPKGYAVYDHHLSKARLGKPDSGYSENNIPAKVILAEEDDSFEGLSERAFGRPDLGKAIYNYNKMINPRFSPKLYKDEHIFLPPRNYLGAYDGQTV